MSNPTTTNYDIRKANISKKGLLKVKANTSVKIGDRIFHDSDVKDRDVKPHTSLEASFNNLVPHALLIGGININLIDESYLTQRQFSSDTKMKGYSCSGFEIKSNETEESVSIFVRKKNTLGSVDFKVGFIKTKGQNTGYPFSGILAEDVDKAVEEVVEFLNGKDAESDQLTINHSESGKDEEEEEEDLFK